MALWYWESLLYTAVVWIAVSLLLDKNRIIDLWPAGLLSSATFFASHIYLETIGLASFREGFLSIFGIPFFHLVWTFAAGILLVNFLQREFSKKVLVVLVFSILGLILDVLSIRFGGHVHSANFTFIQSYVFILTRTIFFTWIAEGLFEERIYGKD